MTQMSRYTFLLLLYLNYYIKKIGSEHVVTLSRTYGTWVKNFLNVCYRSYKMPPGEI